MSFFLDDEETLEEPYGEIWRHLQLTLQPFGLSLQLCHRRDTHM